MDDTEIVSTLRLALVDKVGKERFDLWFGDRVRFEIDSGSVRVLAANQFTLGRLRNKLRSEIEAACEEVLGRLDGLEFLLCGLWESSENPARNSSEDPADRTTMNSPHRSPKSPSVPAPRVAPMKTVSATPVASSPAALKLHAPKASASGAASSGSNGGASGGAAGEAPRRQYARLETFVVGDCNRVAYTAAQTTVSRLGTVSPLFIYGPTGCGKSHLMEGVLSGGRASGRARRAVMLSAEQFTTNFLEALQGSGLPSFRRKHRDVDLLLIDDVQFFAGKKATLIELQHTIDTLVREGRQLVLAADRPPTELQGLGAELVARMSGGLVCGLETPDAETRITILRQLTKQMELIVPKDVLDYLGRQLSGDVRQLRGALNRLYASSLAMELPITMELVRTALADILRSTQRVVRLPDIERAICDVFGLEPKSLQSDRKARTVSQPRMLAMWLARKYTRAALSEIGHYFGRRSHTTVISAQKKVESLLSKNSTIQLDQATCHIEDALRRVESQLRTG